jgi:hypothetical protein
MNTKVLKLKSLLHINIPRLVHVNLYHFFYTKKYLHLDEYNSTHGKILFVCSKDYETYNRTIISVNRRVDCIIQV